MATLFPKSKSGREKLNIWALYLIAYAAGAAWYPLFNVYLKESGLTGIQIGTVSSVIPAVMLAAQPFWGVAADRWGRRFVLLLTLLIASLLIPGFMWNGGYLFFFLWTIGFAIFYNPYQPLMDSLALDYVEESGESSYGRLRMWGAVGWAISAPLVGRIITNRNMNLIFAIAGGLLFLSWFIGTRVQVKKEQKGALDVTMKNLPELLKNRQVVIFLVLVFFLAIGTTSIWTFYSVYLHDIGASRTLIGVAFSVQGISEIPFYFMGSALIRKFGTARVLLFTFVISMLRVFLYSVISLPPLAVLVDITHGVSWALFLVAAVEHINLLVPPKWRATGQSLFWAMYYGAGAILGNWWAGFLYDKVATTGLYRINGFLILVVTIAGIGLLRRDKTGKEPARTGGLEGESAVDSTG